MIALYRIPRGFREMGYVSAFVISKRHQLSLIKLGWEDIMLLGAPFLTRVLGAICMKWWLGEVEQVRKWQVVG